MALNNCSVAMTFAGALQTALDVGAAEYKFQSGKAIAYANGTGAGQADKVFVDTRTIAISGTDDLDLAGVLVDGLGVVITFVKIKAIILTAADLNTNDVVLGAAAATQFVGPFGANTHTVRARPGGLIALACKDATGWAVAAGSTDLLRVANGGAGTSVDYTICIIGTSA